MIGNGTISAVTSACNQTTWRLIAIVYSQQNSSMTIYCDYTPFKTIQGVNEWTYFAARQPNLGIAIGCRQMPNNPMCADLDIACLGIFTKTLTSLEMEVYAQICKNGKDLKLTIFF